MMELLKSPKRYGGPTPAKGQDAVQQSLLRKQLKLEDLVPAPPKIPRKKLGTQVGAGAE